MARIAPVEAGGKNICAFLDLIAFGEVGSALQRVSDDGYNVLVGSTPMAPKLFTSYADHPRVYDKTTNSTAAGRYQILSRYFPPYKSLLKLPDFSPVSQDRIAIQMIKEQKATSLVLNGHIEQAMEAVANIWASMPLNVYGQRNKSAPSVNDFLGAFVKAGGKIA